MIGLSLSFCVQDIDDGKVPYDAVHVLLAGTNAKTPEELETVIQFYRHNYWYPRPSRIVPGEKMLPNSTTRNLLDTLDDSDRPNRCEAIARRLIAEGKFFQSRVYGGNAPQIGLTRWIETSRLDELLVAERGC